MYFSLLNTSLKMAKTRTETCRRFTTCLCIIVSNHSAVGAVFVCVCLFILNYLTDRTSIIFILCNFWHKLYTIKYPVNNFFLIISTRFKVICEIII